MNRRKAKKRVKRQYNIAKWPGNLPPRLVAAMYRHLVKVIGDALDRAILYGDPGRPETIQEAEDALLVPRGILGGTFAGDGFVPDKQRLTAATRAAWERRKWKSRTD